MTAQSASQIVLFGLSTCDSCRKAKSWLLTRGVSFRFHDVREDGMTELTLLQWCSAFGWEKVLNKASTTWRRLPPEQQRRVDKERDAIILMLEEPTLIKRPVLEAGGGLLQGFNPSVWDAALGRNLTPPAVLK